MPEEIEDNALYAVKLNQVVLYGKAELRPISTHEMKGFVLKKIIEELGDAVIDSATPVEG